MNFKCKCFYDINANLHFKKKKDIWLFCQSYPSLSYLCPQPASVLSPPMETAHPRYNLHDITHC